MTHNSFWTQPTGRTAASSGSSTVPQLDLVVENQSFANVSELLFTWKTAAITRGYSVVSSSNGVDSVGAGDNWPNAAAVNDLAWAVLEDASGRQFCAQRVTAGSRHKYSRAAGFVTGGTLTQTPSATDQQTTRGGGTDAAPTAQNFFNFATETFYFVFDRTAYDSAYYWLILGLESGGAYRDALGCFPCVPQADPTQGDPTLHLNYANASPNWLGWNRTLTTWGAFSFYPSPLSTFSAPAHQFGYMPCWQGLSDVKPPLIHYRLQRNAAPAVVTGNVLHTRAGYFSYYLNFVHFLLLSSSPPTIPAAGAVVNGIDLPQLALTPIP